MFNKQSTAGFCGKMHLGFRSTGLRFLASALYIKHSVHGPDVPLQRKRKLFLSFVGILPEVERGALADLLFATSKAHLS